MLGRLGWKRGGGEHQQQSRSTYVMALPPRALSYVVAASAPGAIAATLNLQTAAVVAPTDGSMRHLPHPPPSRVPNCSCASARKSTARAPFRLCSVSFVLRLVSSVSTSSAPFNRTHSPPARFVVLPTKLAPPQRGRLQFIPKLHPPHKTRSVFPSSLPSAA